MERLQPRCTRLTWRPGRALRSLRSFRLIISMAARLRAWLTAASCACLARNYPLHGTAQVMEPPRHGSPSAACWRWRLLPATSVQRYGSRACVLGDGRFAVFGGAGTASCEALTLDKVDQRWDPLPPMHEARCRFVCVAIGGCVIVAGAASSQTVEVYAEAVGRWRRLPCDFPYAGVRYGIIGAGYDGW